MANFKGCGKPIHVSGTNGGTMPCGANLTTLGTTAPEYCDGCRIEKELRELWTTKGVSEEKQNELLRDIARKAQPGAKVGPFTIAATADDDARLEEERERFQAAFLEAKEIAEDFAKRNPSHTFAFSASGAAVGYWWEPKGRFIMCCGKAITGEWVAMPNELLINGQPPVSDWVRL